MSNEHFDQHQLSLELKLRLLAQGMAMGLTPAEAAIYGVEDADFLEEEVYEETSNDLPLE